MTQTNPEQMTPILSEEELCEINAYSRRALTAEEVYTFPLILCDNEIDRDLECFSDETLEQLSHLFCGKSGIFDHDPRGEKQTARIYRCWVEADEGRMTRTGRPYKALHAKAYMVRTASNADLILEIDGGIKKEVSVGCSVASTTCSICGADRHEAPCAHRPGRRYGGALCYTILSDATDAYEWSFVAVPAQPAAGVTKSRGAVKALCLTPERALQQMEAGELHLDAASAMGLRKHIRLLEEQSAVAERYRDSLQQEIRRAVMMSQPEMRPETLQKTLEVLSTPELEELRALTQKQLEQRFPPMLQTAPPKADAAAEGYEHFKI